FSRDHLDLHSFPTRRSSDLEVEVVVDQQNNSTLKGRGAGILLIEINTNGKFQMYGDFQIYEGEFDFRYGGIIQRNIGVVPGGNIDRKSTRLNSSYVKISYAV